MVLYLIILVALMPIFSIPIVVQGIIKVDKYRWICFVCLAFILGVVAYNFKVVDGQNTDLVRHYKNMESVLAYGPASYMKSIHDEGIFLYYYYLAIIGKLGNPRYLSFFSTFITYLILLRIIYVSSRENNVQKLGLYQHYYIYLLLFIFFQFVLVYGKYYHFLFLLLSFI